MTNTVWLFHTKILLFIIYLIWYLSWSLNLEMERDALGIGRNYPNMKILTQAKNSFILQ